MLTLKEGVYDSISECAVTIITLTGFNINPVGILMKPDWLLQVSLHMHLCGKLTRKRHQKTVPVPLRADPQWLGVEAK